MARMPQVLSAAEPVPPGAASGDEGQPIEGLDLGTLEAFVGVAGATVIKPAVTTPTAAAAGAAAAVMAAAAGAAPALARMETGLSEMSNPLEPPVHSVSRSYESDSSAHGGVPAPRQDETAAQAAARADFRRDTAGGVGRVCGTAAPAHLDCMPQGASCPASARCFGSARLLLCNLTSQLAFLAALMPADDEDDFFSSDEESAPTEADSRCANLSGGTQISVGAALSKDRLDTWDRCSPGHRSLNVVTCPGCAPCPLSSLLAISAGP